MDSTSIDKNSFYDEKSILDISQIVQWNKRNNKYNFQSLPATAIISLNKNGLNKLTRSFSKKAKGLMGQNYILNDHLIFCSGFGNGAPAIVNFMEELRVLGVQHFIFVGVAGALTEKNIGNGLFSINKAYSTTGCTALYSPNNDFKPLDNAWLRTLKSKLNLTETVCWSTDAPFRETKSLVTHFIQKNATHVDMECAAIYAFAEFYKLNALCIIVTADSLANDNWIPPGDVKAMNLNLRLIIKKLIKAINA